MMHWIECYFVLSCFLAPIVGVFMGAQNVVYPNRRKQSN